MGLKEKARQGLLTGSLPWGYVKGADGIAEPDTERARYVRHQRPENCPRRRVA